MSLEGTKKLPTLRPSRDLKLTGTNKPKKTVFTPNIPNNRKRQPSAVSAESTELYRDELDIDNTRKRSKYKEPMPNTSNSRHEVHDVKREREIRKRRNNVVTTSIFSCGLAEKVVRRKEGRLEQKEELKDPIQPPTSPDRNGTSSSRREVERECPEEILDPYDESVPRVIPLDKTLNTNSLEKQGDKMLSLWNSRPRLQASLWPGLDPTPTPPGNQGDRSLASDMFNPSDEKAQILFLQIPDKFPVLKPLNPEDTHAPDPTRTLGKTELSSLRHLPQGSVGQVRIHESGRVSMQIGDATFNLLNATPAAFLQELVVIDHPPGSSQGHLTHLGYVSGRMVCSPDLEALASNSSTDKT